MSSKIKIKGPGGIIHRGHGMGTVDQTAPGRKQVLSKQPVCTSYLEQNLGGTFPNLLLL